MTYEEVLEALQKFQKVKRERDGLIRQKAEITETVLGSPLLDGLPHGTSVSNPTANVGAKLAEIDAELERKIIDCADALLMIEGLLDFVSDEQRRTVLRMEYIYGMTYKQIGDKIGYCDRSVSRMVRAAREEIAERCP